MIPRVGLGFDAHNLVAGRKLILGGVEVPHSRGLEGHSDADVLIHAIVDALLGAAGLPDIGHYFSNKDARWKGAASTIFLEEIARVLAEKKFRILNVDCVLIAEAPKIAPFIAEMKKRVAVALKISVDDVGIKASTTEHLGFTGRQEGMAAQAVALIGKPE